MFASVVRLKKIPSLPNKQQGVITLVISLSILMLSTLVVFNVSKAILMEQKVTNNDSRAKHAFEAAEAGMNVAMHYVEGDADTDGDGDLDDEFVFDTSGDGIGDQNTQVVGMGSVTVSLSGTPASPFITATGYSDDRSAQRTLTQAMTTIDPLPNRPQNPLIVRGGIDIGGSATIQNKEGFSTIWSGKEVDPGSSNSVTTQVPDAGDDGYPACMNTPLTCVEVDTSDALGVGADVIENDATLGNLTPDEFFLNFFGTTPTNYRASMTTIIANAANVDDVSHLATSEVIWVDGPGPVTLGNITVGCSEHTPGNTAMCDMTNPKPSILIVDGDAVLDGTFSMYGILFVRGTVSFSGNPKIYGSAVIEGDANSASGSLDIKFSSLVMNQTSLAGASSSSAGSWKDF